ncbi:hypothetical protein niasHS_005527 [Heterodera schachtii]|uniref:Uncharacterized protein n=1 Tax=Heterodera schachtii TaxID=97005 RepID=A0ABD2JN32_HETSC
MSSIRRPTNMTWIIEERCSCLRADAVCIRPEEFTKPIECLNTAHLGSFTEHLLAAPCNANVSINLTDVVQQLNNANIARATGCVNSMVFIFFLFIFLAQVCIFWAMFLNMPARGAGIRRRRPRRPDGVNEDNAPRPLQVFSVVRERRTGRESPQRFGLRIGNVGVEEVSTDPPERRTEKAGAEVGVEAK